MGLFIEAKRPYANLEGPYKMKYINQVDLSGKTVFIRCDFNVPLDENSNITDDTRIRRALPTILYAIDNGAKVVLASHLGRPHGKRDPSLSLLPVAKRLATLLRRPVEFIDRCVGDDVEKRVAEMKPGQVALLENLRFHIEEENDSEEFAREMLKLFDVYVNDAFGVSHRKHASVHMLPKLAPIAVAGFLMKEELETFKKVMETNNRPFVAVVGGAKVSGKLGCLKNLLDKTDKILIGGAQAFTFLKALGYPVGKSLVEDHLMPAALEIMELAKKKGVKLYLPVDFVCSTGIDDITNRVTATYQEIPEDKMGLDIGPATCQLFKEALADAKTVLWNGPMGVFEVKAFSNGTKAVAQAIGESKAFSFVGGGDTAKAVRRVGEKQNMSYISTGGGASLELLEGKVLPAIAVLEEKS